MFDTARDGNLELYIMKADGRDEKNITNSPTSVDTEPTVSPEGNFVAFVSNRGGFAEIYIMPILGGAATLISGDTGPVANRAPDWGQSACTVYGTDGPDTLTGDGHLCGGSGDDHLTAGPDDTTLDGGPGVDTLKGKGRNDDVEGDLATLDAGSDSLFGGEGADTINGGPGNDVVSGGGGNDPHLDGGADSDISIPGGFQGGVFGERGTTPLRPVTG